MQRSNIDTIDPLVLFPKAPWQMFPCGSDDPSFPPGCLQPSEARMLYHLARDCFRGDGAIVDCGAFLGKSAALLAQGVIDNPRLGLEQRRHVIHSYDWFRVCDEHDVRFIRDVAGIELSIGATSRTLFDNHIKPWSELVRVHEGDFLEAAWAEGEIELLFIDICKSPDLNAHVIKTMFPSLSPGRSVVVQQDYHHAHHPVIHTSLELLGDFIQPLAPRLDDSFVFRLKEAVPASLLAAAADVTHLPAERQLDLMESALARLPVDQRHFVGLARAVLIAQLFGKERGISALGEIRTPIARSDRVKWNVELGAAQVRIARY